MEFLRRWRRYVDYWGTTEQERAHCYPCDVLMPDHHEAFFRAVPVDADPEFVWRWLCQLRIAPYSYDLIDNLGRRSPRYLIEGLDQLEKGQVFMVLFKLLDFDERQITLRTRGLFGELLVSYVVLEEPTKLIAKLVVKYPSGLHGWVLRPILRWGDWIMMRKQLLTLKALAEGVATDPHR